MKNIDSVIFDLDGTLWDSCQTCAVGWNRVISKYELPLEAVTTNDIRKVAGKPHDICIRETFANSSEAVLQLLIRETMVEENAAIAELGGMIYPGVENGLRLLNGKLPLFIVSNCMSEYLETFLTFNRYKDFFEDCECWGNTKKTKAENLADLIKRNGLKSPVYVGDTEGDQNAAAKCDIPFLFAEYGFGKATDYYKSFTCFDQLTNFLLPECIGHA